MSERDIYSQTQREFAEYLQQLSVDELAVTCGACPDWSLLDTLAHHVHVQRCLVDGTFPATPLAALVEPDDAIRDAAGISRDGWTAAGVEERRGRTLSELLAKWDDVESAMPATGTALADLSAHFDDIRETVEGPVGRSGADLGESLQRLHQLLMMRLDAVGAGVVGVRCHDSGLELGVDLASAVVAGGEYELLRVMFSRRSRESAAETIDWGEASDRSRDLFAVYGWPEL